MDDLKPCPFCGGTDLEILNAKSIEHEAVVNCMDCGTKCPRVYAKTASGAESMASLSWNTRSVPPELAGCNPDKLADLVAAVEAIDVQLEQVAHEVPAEFRRPINKIRIIIDDALAAFWPQGGEVQK